MSESYIIRKLLISGIFFRSGWIKSDHSLKSYNPITTIIRCFSHLSGYNFLMSDQT